MNPIGHNNIVRKSRMEFCVFFMIWREYQGVLSILFKKGIIKMKARYFYQANVYDLEYSNVFQAFVEYESTPAGLRCTISLGEKEGDNEFNIGAITSRDYDMGYLQSFVENMLNNKSYCTEIWRRRMRDKRKKTDAAQ